MAFRNFSAKLIVACSLMLHCIGCTAVKPQKTLTLATFNMEWLGDNTPDDRKIRSAQDLMLLTNVIRDTEADILAMQEVENPESVKLLLKYLPDYSFVLGETGGKQHVGFLYKTALTQNEFRITPRGEIQSVAVEPQRTRAALLLDVSINNKILHFLTVHLKASSRADSTPELLQRSYDIRRRQAAQLRVWCDSVQQRDSLAQVIILGDFNDSPIKKNTTLDTLHNASNLVFLTSDNRSCTFQELPAIDHILCSKSIVKSILRGSLHTINLHAMLKEDEVKRVSDHCPVVCRIVLSE